MYKDVQLLARLPRPAIFILCAGFERRVTRAAQLLKLNQIDARRVITIVYEGGGEENLRNLKLLRKIATTLCRSEGVVEVSTSNLSEVATQIESVGAEECEVVLDATGMSRMIMMRLLAIVYNAGVRPIIVYTEAKEYYPTKTQFRKLTKGGARPPEDAFLTLNQFEKAEILYSMHCEVEEVAGVNGYMLPNYPLMLIAFLTFKRGRLAAVFNSYEANVRVLIKSVPVRPDLRWRSEAIEIPNLDLIEDSTELVELETLDWHVTYDYLKSLYERENNRYKCNFVLAPLGSKMQTIGAWLFARERPEIRVVTSTPKTLYHKRYSRGFGQTFLIDDLPKLPIAQR